MAEFKPFRHVLRPMAFFVSLAMAGCALRPAMDSDLAVIDRSRGPAASTLPPAQTDVDAGYATFDGFVLTPSPAKAQQAVPGLQKPVARLSVTESSVYDAIQLLSEEAGLSLSIDGGARALERYGAIAMYNLSGTVEQVLNKMSARMGFHWYAEDGLLVIEQEQPYVLDLPPALADDNLSSMTNTLQHLGVKDVYLDHQQRTLTFKANKRVIPLVAKYVDNVRTTRSMIVYAINVWQVDLSDANRKGIDWNKFGLTYAQGGLGIANTGTTAAGMGMVINRGALSVDGIVGYLETQGTVKTISQPRIAILTGTKGKLAVGQSTAYVSKVGSNLAGTVSQVTVETQNLQTGMQLMLHGDVHDNTVYTSIHLTLADLLRMNKYTALGTDLNLPQTASRELETTTRARPGDTILLGGFTINQDSADSLLGFVGLSSSVSSTKSELVIAIRPVLVSFTGRSAVVPPAAAPVEPEKPAAIKLAAEQPSVLAQKE